MATKMLPDKLTSLPGRSLWSYCFWCDVSSYTPKSCRFRTTNLPVPWMSLWSHDERCTYDPKI